MDGTSSVSEDRSISSDEDDSTERPSRSQLRMWIQEHLHSGDKGMTYTAEQILPLLDRARQAFLNEATLIDLKAPPQGIKICGDIHGQFVDLKSIFRANGKPPKQTMLFLGDYVDRGPHSLEVIVLLLCFKVKDPGRMFLLRGNHESANINRVYGFYDELQKRNLIKLWPEFNKVFSCMPLAARVQRKILCMHGGISQFIKRLSDIRQIEKPLTHPPTNRIALDLLWADPDKNSIGYTKSVRGVSYHFGLDALEEFCVKMGIDIVVRGHQCVMNGFERIECNHRTRLVTVFSAPKYCGAMDNNAAVMHVRENLSIKFNVLEVNPNTVYNARRDYERLLVPIMDMYPKLDNYDFNVNFEPLAKGAVKVLDGMKGKACKLINKMPGQKPKPKNESSRSESSSNESSSGSETQTTIAINKPQKQESHSHTETPKIPVEQSKVQKEETKSPRDNTTIRKVSETTIQTIKPLKQETHTETPKIQSLQQVQPANLPAEQSKVRKEETKSHRDDNKSHRDNTSNPKDENKSHKDDSKNHKDENKNHKDDNKIHKDDNSQRDDSKSRKDVTKSQKDDTKTQKGDTKSQKEDTKSQKGDTKSQKEGTKSQKGDTKSQKEDTKSQKGDTKSQKEDTKSQKDDTKSQKEDTKSRRNDSNSERDESSSHKEDSKSRRDTNPKPDGPK